MIPTLLMVVGVYRRSYRHVGLSVGLAAFYALYRLWIVGRGIDYTMPLVNANEYVSFLLRLPYMLTASGLGYVVYLGTALLTGVLVWKEKSARKALLLMALLGVAALVALYPVTYAVLASYQTPGTWYRVPFIINTLLVMWSAYALARLLPRRFQWASIVLVGLMVLPATYQARQYWQERKLWAAQEAAFYLSNPEILLYSEVDASWFLLGVSEMYALPLPHYIHPLNCVGGHAVYMLTHYSTIWRYQNGQYAPDDLLYQTLQQENSLSP